MNSATRKSACTRRENWCAICQSRRWRRKRHDGGIPDDIVEKVFPVLEIASPYAYSDLWDNEEQCCKIQTIQHSDILYIFNEDFR